MKLDILAFGAHPDDVELGCGATIAKEIALGKKVGIVDLTRGELGTRGSADLRTKESTYSMVKMGAKFRWNANLADGFFANDKESQLKVVKYIRSAKPDIVLANTPHDRHPDHGRASKLTREAFVSSTRWQA